METRSFWKRGRDGVPWTSIINNVFNEGQNLHDDQWHIENYLINHLTEGDRILMEWTKNFFYCNNTEKINLEGWDIHLFYSSSWICGISPNGYGRWSGDRETSLTDI